MSKQEQYRDEYDQQNYQINTSKVIKGHKITMKDFINKKRIKSKKSSPIAKTNNEANNEFITMAPKITEFSQKYKGLQTLDEQQSLYRFITYQREKQSRQSARGIKLFSCQKRVDSFDEDSFINNHISFSARNAKTSQSTRKPHSAYGTYSQNKTVQYDNGSGQSLQKVTYQSNNLGNRMNQYLNIILQKKEKAELVIKQDQIKEEAELFKLKNDLVNQVRVMNKNIKIKTNNFYRQMKKTKKSRIASAKTIVEEPSNELVKSLMRKTAKVPGETTLSSQRPFLKSFSAKVRAQEQMNVSTSKSFYSSKDGSESATARMKNILNLIYK